MNTNDTDTTYSITVNGQQVMLADFATAADTLKHTFGIHDATADLVGEYYGPRGEDVVVAVYG